jgi:hypothetical protein
MILVCCSAVMLMWLDLREQSLNVVFRFLVC